MADDEFMVIVPMLCHSCGTPLANKQILYEKYRKVDTFESVMERIGIRRYCCRMHFTSPSNIPYGGPDKPYGSIAEYEVSPDIIQVWTGVMSRVAKKVVVPQLLTEDNIGSIETSKPIVEDISIFEEASQPLSFGTLKSPTMKIESFGSALDQILESTPNISSIPLTQSFQQLPSQPQLLQQTMYQPRQSSQQNMPTTADQAQSFF